MTVDENKAQLDRLQDEHNECQKERIELSVLVRQIHAKFLADGKDGWANHALLVLKALKDLEAGQRKANNRIWSLVVGLLMLALGIVIKAVLENRGS